jgi:hypothetical protein
VLTPAERTTLYNSGNGLGYPFNGTYVAPPVTLLSHLSAYWNLEHTSFDPPDNHNGYTLMTNNTVPSVAGKIGNGRDIVRSFGGYMTQGGYPFSPSDTDFSISFWVKCRAYIDSDAVLVGRCEQSGATNTAEYILSVSSPTGYFVWRVFSPSNVTTALFSDPGAATPNRNGD